MMAVNEGIISISLTLLSMDAKQMIKYLTLINHSHSTLLACQFTSLFIPP